MQHQSKRWKVWSAFTALNRLALTAVFAAVILAQQAASDATSVQAVHGALYAENFTYYKLSGEGWLRLELHSLQGDVDLYVSGLTLHPSFTEYELKSDSCGVDIVDIHSAMNRPVGIGIYAHPFYVQSAYRLDIMLVKEYEVDEYERLFQSLHYYSYDGGEKISEEDSKTRKDKKSNPLNDSEEDSEESIWWTILITFLKFVFEVIT